MVRTLAVTFLRISYKCLRQQFHLLLVRRFSFEQPTNILHYTSCRNRDYVDQIVDIMLGPVARSIRSPHVINLVPSRTRSRALVSTRMTTAFVQSGARNWSLEDGIGKVAFLSHRSSNSSSTPERRPFSTSTPRWRDHHFDTLKFVQRLKDDGFTEEQAVAMMKILSDVIEERLLTPSPTLSRPS